MIMDLSQMQVIQSSIEALKVKLIPVVKYNGQLITASFYDDKFNLLERSFKKLNLDNVDNASSGNPIVRSNVDVENTIIKSHEYVMERGYESIVKDKTSLFLFLEHVANKFAGTPIPVDFLTNVKYLESSSELELDFVRLGENPKFDFISLVSNS